MSTKRKKPTKKVAKKAKKQVQKVTFKDFFSRNVILGLVQERQEREILAFFKAQDLKDKEDLDVYQKTLEKY